jgi:ABC-type uncharacterized transport system involved in gliding motility auxiliary subunit
MEKMSRKTEHGVLAALAVVLLFAINILASTLFSNLRIDLTEERLFTISEGTHNILKSLEDPIEIKFYFSQKRGTPYPSFLRYGQRVRDLLKEYESLSDGNLKLTIIDPEPFSEAEDIADGYGLDGQVISDSTKLYLGLVASDASDRESVIPYFTEARERFLEYELTKTIYGLGVATRPKLALLSSLPLRFGPGGPLALIQGRGRPYILYQQLDQFFDLHDLGADFAEIPEDTDVLLLAHPPALSDAQLYKIDQFIMAGGRAVLLADPFSEAAVEAAAAAANMGTPVTLPEASDLSKLTEAWGLVLHPGKIVVDFRLAQKINMGGLGPRSVRDYIPWLAVSQEFINSDDFATGSLGQINLATSGAFELVEGAGTEITPLLTSSTDSSLMDSSEVQGDPDPDVLMRLANIDNESYILFARISGSARSAFGEALPEGADNERHLAAAEGGINVVVGADVDFLDDRFWVQIQETAGQRYAVPFADNGAFLIGAIDHLAGSTDLVQLRSRGISDRPFDRVDTLKRKAEARFLAEEQTLQNKVRATEARLEELRGRGPAGSDVLNPAQEAEIRTFQSELLETRRALRAVQRNLRSEIERLGTWLAFLNIAGVPILLGLGTVAIAVRRRKRRA